MPTTLTALIAIVTGIVPGVLGESIYQAVAGSDWRESEWERAVRIITISVAGLLVTLAVMAVFHIPETLRVPVVNSTIPVADLMPWVLIYIAHFVASSIVGAVAAWTSRKIRFVGRIGAYPDTWDVFVRDLVPRHWVVVTLKDGTSYAGMLEKADMSVREEERDIVLTEPARYDAARDQYITTQYQYLHLTGALVASVAVYYDPRVDSRVTEVETPLFRSSDEQDA